MGQDTGLPGREDPHTDPLTGRRTAPRMGPLRRPTDPLLRTGPLRHTGGRAAWSLTAAGRGPRRRPTTTRRSWAMGRRPCTMGRPRTTVPLRPTREGPRTPWRGLRHTLCPTDGPSSMGEPQFATSYASL